MNNAPKVVPIRSSPTAKRDASPPRTAISDGSSTGDGLAEVIIMPTRRRAMTDSLFQPEPPSSPRRIRQVVFTVHGSPAPQGSKKGFYNKHTGRVQMVESSKKVKPWRQAVVAQALDHVEGGPFTGALEVRLRFMMARPKGHYGTGRNAGKVKESAPAYPAVMPDLDKLARSTLDGLGDAGVFTDDSRIVTLRLEKRYTDYEPHCDVVVREAVE
jgi:Holliday junction resolvase RusA-like endonuclease